jgi:aminocarboxymuconate-semialdehyde decarboxylase
MLAHLIARFGADHVLLGTDYPYDMGVERPVEFIEGVKGLSAVEKDAIHGGNAARLLKIDYNAAQRRRT